MRYRASSSRTSEGRGQFSQHQREGGETAQLGPETSPWPQVVVQITDIHMALIVTQATDINTEPRCSRTTDLDVVLTGSIGPDISMASDGSTDLSGQPVPHGHRVSSSSSLHSTGAAPLLFLCLLSSTHLLLWRSVLGQACGLWLAVFPGLSLLSVTFPSDQ